MDSHCDRPGTSDVMRPLVIVSAARSGSKLLRDLICASKDCACYPYDINYVWKYGNYELDHDELEPAHLNEKKRRFIRCFLNRPALKYGTPILVEKTVSNSLRLGYVRRVLPDARIVHLIRDGRDVVASTMDCWQETGASKRNQDQKIMWRKLTEFPPQAWRYGFEYLRDNLGMVLTGRRERKTWGPRFRGIDDMIATQSLSDVCSRQWTACVESALDELSCLSEDDDYITVNYEKLVSSPGSEIDRIAAFVGIHDVGTLHAFGRSHFTEGNIAKWKRGSNTEQQARIECTILPVLERLGYDRGMAGILGD